MSKTTTNQPYHGGTMSLGDHLEELRIRLILAIVGLAAALVVCLVFGRWIISFIEIPYIKAMGEDARLQTIAPTEGFVSYMGIAMIAAVILASPWIFYQLWLFISAGLYPKEKRYIYLAIPFSTILFVTGALFFIFIISPVTLRFLVIFDRLVLRSNPNWTFPQYLSFVSMMMLVFGLAFQTPVAIFFLNKTGLVSIKALCKSRKYVVLAVVFVAAAATPGSDLFSLFALAIPMYLLFELGILLSYLSNRRKRLQNSP
ncbi:MAG: twin-arginine translocase subunit TatC [Phycisphaerae bacterium]|nr:twin-arginine translocase subunit TatC [Phycisphaerae bacterium]